MVDLNLDLYFVGRMNESISSITCQKINPSKHVKLAILQELSILNY